MLSGRVKPHSSQYGGRVPLQRRLLLGLFCAFSAVLSACGGTEVVLPDDADEQIVEGFEIYKAHCARCHGQDGGGGIGLSLQLIEDRLSDDEQREVVERGRKRMPTFGTKLTSDEIDAVVRFTREIL